MEVLLLGVGLLRAAVCVAEDGTEDSEGDGVVEGRAESDGRGLDGGEVCRDGTLAIDLYFDAMASPHAAITSYDPRPARCRKSSSSQTKGART